MAAWSIGSAEQFSWFHVKLDVFFSAQGYPQALLPLAVAGIPSIHICLDFIPELLAQPQLEKQVTPPSCFCSRTSSPVFIRLASLVFAVDLCHPVAVLPVYAVRLTQIPERGPVGHQCDGNPSDRSAALADLCR